VHNGIKSKKPAKNAISKIREIDCLSTYAFNSFDKF
jgi:hypothetical protein